MNPSFKGSTNVVRLSHFRPILMDINKIYSHFKKRSRICISKELRSITPSSYTLFYFFFKKNYHL